MRRNRVTITGTGSTAAVPMDVNKAVFAVGMGVVVTGTINYTIEHTFDDPAVVLTTWYPHVTVAAQTTNKDANYAFPVTAIRLTTNSGTGTATLTILQAG